MSRSGYDENIDNWALIRWRGAVASALRGKRGQAFLREMLAAMDALPEPVLIQHELQNHHGEVCGLGSVCVARGLDLELIAEDDPTDVATWLEIAPALAAEIAYINDDEYPWREDPRRVFRRVRAWIVENLSEGEEEK